MTSENLRTSRRIGSYVAVGALMLALGFGAATTFDAKFPAAQGQAKDIPTAPAGGDPKTTGRLGDTALPDLVERLMPSVVNIATIAGQAQARPAQRPDAPFDEYFRDYFDRHQGPRQGSAVGSGFVISADGYVVTNNHVIANATEVKVILQDGTTLPAKLVGKDPRADLALLKVETTAKLVPVVWGKSEVMRLGDSVIAIGNPFGLGGTVTTGIISALHRHLSNFGGIPGSSFVDFLQTDAAINKGNSGGPLFNTKGEVIGINTAIYSRQGTNVGIAFSIPSDLAIPIVEQLKKYGKTSRGWLGVQIKEVDDDVAKALGLKSRNGAVVVNAVPGGPAAQAGILAGDVIIRFNGRAVPDDKRLPQIVAGTEVGKTVDVVLVRKGQEMTLKVKLGELEKAADAKPDEKAPGTPPAPGTPVLGMKLGELTAELRQRFNIQGGEGVVVTEVDPKSQANEKGIKAGDVIVEMDLTKVTKPAEIADLLKKAEQGRKTSVLLLVQRGEDRRFVALRIGG
ncbi:MAG TPA: Do family serine endopeptidase [Alphaproteobacteria bacterium]